MAAGQEARRHAAGRARRHATVRACLAPGRCRGVCGDGVNFQMAIARLLIVLQGWDWRQSVSPSCRYLLMHVTIP